MAPRGAVSAVWLRHDCRDGDLRLADFVGVDVMLTIATHIATLLAGIGIGAGGLYLWAVMLDPSAPGDGLEKYYDQ